jgi:hypothetical protein
MEGMLFLFLGMGAVFALSSMFESNSNNDEQEQDPQPEGPRLENRVFAGPMVLGTPDADLITPRDLEEANIEAREMFGRRVFDVFGREGNDTIIAAAFGDPDDETRELLGQDGLRLHGGKGDDLIISATNGRNIAFGGAGDDTLVGANTALYGGDGDDVIFLSSFYDDFRAETHWIRGGAGNDSIHVFNGFADIRVGEGTDEVILTYDRPALDENGNPDAVDPGFGDVLIQGFRPFSDSGAIILPPAGTGNIELAGIAQDYRELRIGLVLTVPPSAPDGEETIFRARVTVQDIDSMDQVRVVDEDGRRVIYFGQTDGFEPRDFDTELEARVLDVHFPEENRA